MSELMTLPLHSIRPHPANPRFDLGDLTELTEDIRDSGLIEPLVVVPGSWGKPSGECRDCAQQVPRGPHRVLDEHAHGSILCPGGSEPAGDEWFVIAGHRRREASLAAGLWEVPCIVRHDLKTDADVLVVMLRENILRRDLTALEEAAGYQQLTLFGLTPTRIAQQTHRSKRTVDRRLALLELPEKARRRLRDGAITLGDAEALLDLPPDTADQVLRSVGTKEFRQEVTRHRLELVRDQPPARDDVAAALRAEFLAPYLAGTTKPAKDAHDRLLREVVVTIAQTWPHRPTVRTWLATLSVTDPVELSGVPPIRALLALAVTVETSPAGIYDLLGVLGYELSPVEIDILEGA